MNIGKKRRWRKLKISKDQWFHTQNRLKNVGEYAKSHP